MALQAEESSLKAEKGGVVSSTHKYNNGGDFSSTAQLLFQKGTRSDPWEYDQQANNQGICNLNTIFLFQHLAISSSLVENTK